jgi:cytochrome c biogenesis protein CcmG/thiol:disulfide interchange protein DsbE
MTTKLFTTFLAAICTVLSLSAQIKPASLKTLEGKKVTSNQVFKNDSLPIIISFWATWCKPCLNEMEAISEVYDDWVEETGVKLIAVSIDDPRSHSKVAPMAYGMDWPFEVYIDEISELKRAYNVTNIPYTIILNKKGEIAWRHSGYTPGSEIELIEKVRELTNNN